MWKKNKKTENSHLEMAKANRAKCLGQAEKCCKNGTWFPFTHAQRMNKEINEKKWKNK